MKRLVTSDSNISEGCRLPNDTYPIVVMKLVVNEPSENLKSRQLFPTPERFFKGLLIVPEVHESGKQITTECEFPTLNHNRLW